MSQIIEALERDSSWVSIYNITGEVNVPELENTLQDDASAVLKEAIKVRSFLEGRSVRYLTSIKRLSAHRHPPTPTGVWRELRLPVDIPVKSVGLALSKRANLRALNRVWFKDCRDHLHPTHWDAIPT